MSRKKARKPGKKMTAQPQLEAEAADPVASVPESQSVESDAPAAPRQSIETDEGVAGGDVERAGQ